MLSDSIIILIIGSASALLGLIIKSCYASKCTVIRCGNCFQIERDTIHEQPIQDIRNQNTPNNI